MSIGQAGVGPKGLSSATLELLADPKKLNKTLASLQEAQRQAQEAIDLAGPAQEILQIRVQVEGELEKQRAATEEAEAVLQKKTAEAETKADDIVAAAVEKANELAADAEQAKQKSLNEAAAAQGEVRRAEQGLVAQRDQITQAQDQLDEVRAALDERESGLNSRSADLDELNRSLLEEKAKLTGIREHLTNALR